MLDLLRPHWWNLPVYASLAYLVFARGLPNLYVTIPRWWNMPLLLSVLYLSATREQLSSHNLYDTYLQGERPNISCQGINTAVRTINGICNSLDMPAMGAAGARFARFVPINDTYGESESSGLYTPNPRAISQELFKREVFKPATSINNLAAAWIQFQVHDWFSHGSSNDPDNFLSFPLPADDQLRVAGQTDMTIRRTLREPHSNRPATYDNVNTHWWDLSQIYGSDEATHATLRSYVDGKMKVNKDDLLPVGKDGIPIAGDNDDWWIGLSVIHNIWVREHNLVCDMFKASYPTWNDTQLFDRARLVTTALNAKIHTVEWTPALLQDKILKTTMQINWNGIAPKWLRFVPIMNQHIAEVYYGIMGGKPDFAGVPFAHSEEFVSVYRFHSLLRDNITIRNHVDNKETGKTYDIPQYTFQGAQDVVRENKFGDIVYTFGTDNPGALVLGNYPAAMTHLQKPGYPYTLDMGAIDVLRDRERGVPRYNQFRRLFSLIPAKTMDDISDDKDAVAALRSIYGEDVESVDLLAGSLAESPRPTGFAFSNTQFQVFILAASRRLMTDRFFTTDYTADVYTQEGLDWIEKSDFRDVIGRTVPELNASAHSVDNAFKPWVVPSS
ncbi:heme peroxidase [Roridomyces roridus]|uniref:Heme peroxidase n=1 Tax=Roridomyces roridus TaxID=1738132 RepID=A0AAD7FPZ7_9AGAR|nr:heme peroxidase [Roridomyces roridus]